MSAEGELEYRRWRAPREHGSALIEPALSDVDDCWRQNQRRLGQSAQFRFSSPSDLRRQARLELFDIARRHTLAYRDAPGPLSPDTPCWMAGHQPEMFHPGVWFKNYVLSALGQRFAATAINLVIDNDTPHSTAIRVPLDDAKATRVEPIPFDQGATDIAFEERTVIDAALFASFGRRVREAIAPLVANPLIERYWPLVLEILPRMSNNIGLALAAARHRIEADHGLKTWEAPLSQVCETIAFRRFLLEMFGRAAELHAIHNAALDEYRRVNRVRSQTHPVPALAVEQDWLELPLWMWTADEPRRRRLFVRATRGGVEVTDRQRQRIPIALPESGCHGNDCIGLALEQLDDLSRAGVRFRPRALATTMFARLVLSDLFLHGIGGGKYDQLTDVILRRFFEVEPPEFMVLTATTHLPITIPSVADDDLRETELRLRRLEWNPEQFLPADAPEAARRLAADKREWLERDLTGSQRRNRHAAIQRINTDLQPFVAPQREAAAAEWQRVAAELRRRSLLASREFSFCLFPEESLCKLLLELSMKGA